MVNKIFNKNDFNSSDGMLTSVWGPSLWHSLHTISFNYPVKPTNEDKKNYYLFFKQLGKVLPCKYCRDNYIKNIQSVKLNKDTMKNRDTLSRWLYNLHEHINTMLGKKSNLTYETIRERYEMFRARCLSDEQKNVPKTKKLKRENGCVKPLYGVKSKCIIKIVPKHTKCKTFNIDKKCILKKFTI